MNRRRWLGLMLATTFAAALGIGSVGSARVSARVPHASARVAGVGGDVASVIAQDGFGDPQNSYAWGMAWFKGKLYVGTGRSVICVERETSDFYYPFAHRYVTNPEPGVHCPANPYSMNLRAEIWQYTPQTGRWLMVYRAPPGLRNPRAPRKHLSPDIAYRGMTVYTDPHGRQALFVSAVSANEYVPELARRQPPRLLRTFDGTHFHNIGVPIIIHRTGIYTDHRAIGFRGLTIWRGQLYVLASTALTGDGAVMRVDHPWSDHAHFTQVSPRGIYVFEMQTYRGDLYFGAGDPNAGYSVWKLGRTRPPYRLQPIVTHGAGRGHLMTSVVSMQVYRNHLYVAAVGWYCITCNALPTTELIRIGPTGHWQVVVGNQRFVPNESLTKYPISGLGDGFDNIYNSHMWRVAVSGNAMYVGTLDWSWLLQKSRDVFGGHPGVLSSLLAGELGFDIWATCDGRDFFPVTRDAFGIDEYDFGVRTLIGVHGGFYIGTADHAHGTRIFHEQTNVCSSLVGGAQAPRIGGAHFGPPPAAPRALLTDAQHRGTVLSWEPGTHAMRYAVLRAQYLEIPFTFQRPTIFPGGFMLDDAVPVPAVPGSPDTAATTLTVPGPYTQLGMTRSRYFVDQTRRLGVKYAYQVVAETGSGQRSIGSNVQVVPDPRPPATFGQLYAALPVSNASVVRAVAKRDGCTRTLAELTRLARAAGSDTARELAYRLERRLEYRDVAGGPMSGSATCG